LHQVGTSSLLTYMMHGHTYIKLTFMFEECVPQTELHTAVHLSTHLMLYT